MKKQTNRIPVSFVVSEELFQKIFDTAGEQNKKISEFVRDIIANEIKKIEKNTTSVK